MVVSVPAAAAICTVSVGVDYFGADLPGGASYRSTLEACTEKCRADVRCTHFTFAWGNCYRKHGTGTVQALASATSGVCTREGTAGVSSVTITGAPITDAPTTDTEQPTAQDMPAEASGPVEYVRDEHATMSIVDLGVGARLPYFNTSQGALQNGIFESEGGAVNGKLYVFGGFKGSGWKKKTKETLEYNPATNAWAYKTPIPASYAGVSHTAQAIDEANGMIYLIGGLALQPGDNWPRKAYPTKDTFAYNANKDTWTVLPDLPAPRGGGAAVILGSKLHFFNGASFDGANGGFQKDHTDHWVLDLKAPANGWKTLASNSIGRNHLGAAVHGNTVYAVGGQFLEDEGCTNQVLTEAYNSKTNKWTKVTPLPVGTGHISPATISTKYGIIVVGGAVDKNGCHPPGTHRKQLFFYNPADGKGGSWTELFNGQNGASMVSGMIGNVIYAQHGGTLNKIGVNWEQKTARGKTIPVWTPYQTKSIKQQDTVAKDRGSSADSSGSAPVFASATSALLAAGAVLAVVVVIVGAAAWQRRKDGRRLLDNTMHECLSETTIAPNLDLEYDDYPEV